MTVFTIVDFKKCYWIVVLHPESRKLTCMVLPFGRFQWTRLPMGTMVAQNIFQSKLDSIFIGMEGVIRIADDMVIAGRDELEHDRNFLAFMEKCVSNNLTLNSEKIQFKQSQVSFYGHCWSKHGISPDPKKIKALNHMKFPLDKETMGSFLGMINYLNRYSALSAHLAAPLIALTHQLNTQDVPTLIESIMNDKGGKKTHRYPMQKKGFPNIQKHTCAQFNNSLLCKGLSIISSSIMNIKRAKNIRACIKEYKWETISNY